MTGDPKCPACDVFERVEGTHRIYTCTGRPGCVRHPDRENPAPESDPAGADVPFGITDIVDLLLVGTVMGAVRSPGDTHPPVDKYRTDALMAEAADEIVCLRAVVEKDAALVAILTDALTAERLETARLRAEVERLTGEHAALVEQGRREGIEEAAREVEKWPLLRTAAAIRALATPADGDPR
jgi:hypothetical protein